MAAYKFYNQYALKTNDGEYYLESMEDRVFFNALILLTGTKQLRLILPMKSSTNATNLLLLPFLNAGRARRGSWYLVS